VTLMEARRAGAAPRPPRQGATRSVVAAEREHEAGISTRGGRRGLAPRRPSAAVAFGRGHECAGSLLLGGRPARADGPVILSPPSQVPPTSRGHASGRSRARVPGRRPIPSPSELRAGPTSPGAEGRGPSWEAVPARQRDITPEPDRHWLLHPGGPADSSRNGSSRAPPLPTRADPPIRAWQGAFADHGKPSATARSIFYVGIADDDSAFGREGHAPGPGARVPELVTDRGPGRDEASGLGLMLSAGRGGAEAATIRAVGNGRHRSDFPWPVQALLPRAN